MGANYSLELLRTFLYMKVLLARPSVIVAQGHFRYLPLAFFFVSYRFFTCLPPLVFSFVSFFDFFSFFVAFFSWAMPDSAQESSSSGVRPLASRD